jgi:hypothetical protein
LADAILTELSLRSLAAAAILLAAAPGCRIEADYDGTSFRCPGGVCPEGYRCEEGLCLRGGGAGGDGGSDAPIGADAGDCQCSAEPFADDCGAGLVDLDGAGAPGGERVCASTEMNTNAVLGCNPPPLPGRDAVFRVAVSAGQSIEATVRPEGFDAAIYLATDCGGECLAVADDRGQSGAETVTLTAAAAADYFVVIDSPSGFGCYELIVEVTD